MRELLALLAPVLAFVVAWRVTRACCRPGAWLYFLDQPNERSLHVTPTPRTGGVGVMTGLLVGGALVWVAGLGSLPLGAALAGAVGLALVGLATALLHLNLMEQHGFVALFSKTLPW